MVSVINIHRFGVIIVLISARDYIVFPGWQHSSNTICHLTRHSLVLTYQMQKHGMLQHLSVRNQDQKKNSRKTGPRSKRNLWIILSVPIRMIFQNCNINMDPLFPSKKQERENKLY